MAPSGASKGLAEGVAGEVEFMTGSLKHATLATHATPVKGTMLTRRPLPAIPTARAALATAFFIAIFLICMRAEAQSVALGGVMGNKALLVVNGSAPKGVAAGETHQGVKVVSVSADQVLVEIQGQRSTLRLGAAPVSVGGAPGSAGGAGTKIVLPMGSGGHFYTQGQINKQSIQFLVDTGATTVSLGESDAKRLGLDYQSGRPVRLNTANGTALGWAVKLSSVKIGDVEVFDVDAIVGPNMPYALLGNSFLSRFSMNRNNDMMVLERRY
jgi:aspartyl protease family protein